MAPHDRLTTLLDKPTAATPPDVPSVLAVDGLTIAYGGTQVVHGVDLAVGRGRSLALIGESGSGKSTIARALLRLLPDGGRAQGRALFEGVDVLALPERRFRPLRGRSIGFVPQDPGASLNPVRTIGAQGLEAAALLDLDSKAERREAVLETLAQVGLDEPRRVAASYPHELSGGMLQRVLIGLAVLPAPRSSSPTSRPRPWTSPSRSGSSTCSPTCRPTSATACCSSPTTWPSRPSAPTRSSCSRTGRCTSPGPRPRSSRPPPRRTRDGCKPTSRR
ncbi:ATP-binding cassette domain-containing protein [Nocardioides zeae]